MPAKVAVEEFRLEVFVDAARHRQEKVAPEPEAVEGTGDSDGTEDARDRHEQGKMESGEGA